MISYSSLSSHPSMLHHPLIDNKLNKEIEDKKGNNDVNMLYMPWINNKAFFSS